MLADEQGKVLTWERSDEEIFINHIRGGTWEQLFQQPKRIGIGKDATYPIFCKSHDNGIFVPLEKLGVYNETEQAALMAYRALCYKTWNPRLGEKLEFELSNLTLASAEELRRLFSLNLLLAAQENLATIVHSKDYKPLRWIKRILKIHPCIACVGAFVPYNGAEDKDNIVTGKTLITPEDYVTFTFYPDRKLRASICVITGFNGNARGEGFIDLLNPDNSSEDEVFHRIFEYALSMSLVYTSQKFWDYLSSQYKENYVRLRMENITVGKPAQYL